MLLALDISTSIIGWSTWKEDEIQDQGFVYLSDYKGNPKELHERLDKAIDYFKEFSGVTEIAAEAALQKFTKGKTTANTMNKLIAMNFGLTYNLSRLWDVPIKYIAVNQARKICGVSVPKKPRGSNDGNWTKRHVTKQVAKKYPMIKFEWTSSGNAKKGHDDMADSIVIGEAVTHSV